MKNYLFIIAATASLALVVGCKGGSVQVAEKEVAQKVLVKVDAAVSEKVARVEVFSADLKANKHNFIVPAIPNRIESIHVEVGDQVKKDQLLVTMDKNQLNQAKAQLAQAETTLARLKQVSETGGVSQQQLDELTTNITVLKESTESLITNLELRSPIDGIVTGRYNEEGDLFTMTPNADQGVGILRVMDMDKLKAYVWVSEKHFTSVYDGMAVEISTDIYPGETFGGKVSRIAPAINPFTRSFEVEVTIPNQKHTLRPGMFARTTFNMGEVKGVTVKDIAVQKQTGTNDMYLFVVKDGVAERRGVETGRRTGDRIEILSGVEAGEKVVVAGMSKLMSGVEVEVNN